MPDLTTLEIDTGDVTQVVVTTDATNITSSSDGDITILNAVPATISVASGSSYRHIHTQTVASDTWIVYHNLGSKPGGVSVVSNADEVVYGDVVYVSDDQLTVRFTSPFTGKVYIS